ncbi:MAG TPA: addiction module protein [Thermoanaerobaculia bacterium]|nr:addiction module protein [Thermoanaerobaculia bacterium]
MGRKIEDLTSEVLSLEPQNRAALALALLDSLEDLSAEENERLWAEEAEARYMELKAGGAKAIPGDEVFARVRARRL